MNVEEATIWLEKCLRHRGFNFHRPDPILGWQTFKSFALEPITSDGGAENESLWFEMGDGDLDDDSPGTFDFVRQFFKYEDDIEWPQQITLRFACPSQSKLSAHGIIMASDYFDVAAFFRAVESSELFQAGIAFREWSCEVRLDDCG